MARALLYIGASSASDLDQFLDDSYDHALVTAATSNVAEELECLRENFPTLAVKVAAVASNSAGNTWYEYNLPEFSSTHKPSGLKKLYAGLRVVDSYQVDVLSPEELLKSVPLPEGIDHTLVINEKGEEVAILRQLIENDLLQGFSKIVLAARELPYYEGEYTIEAILEELVTLHFELGRKPSSGSEWPVWQFSRNPLRQEVEALKVDLDNALQVQEAATIKLTNNQTAYDQKLQQLEKSLSNAMSEVELNKKATKEAEDQLSKRTSQWEKERSHLEDTVGNLEGLLERERSRADGLEQKNSLQVKLLAKMEADVQDLRRRYFGLQQRERELTDLIKELHGKLELASGFFRQLKSEHPELLDQY